MGCFAALLLCWRLVLETPISEDLDLSAVKIDDAVWPNSTESVDKMSAKVTEM